MKLTLGLLAATMACAVAAEDRAALDHFESRVRPLLSARCEPCHGAEKQKGALRLDSREGWVAGGSRGAVIVPGNPTDSLLIQAVRRGDPHLQMPPDEALSESEVAALEQWITSGAPDSRDTPPTATVKAKADPRTFWSFQPVRAVPPPEVAQPDWVRTPVDNFILAKLNEKGLTPAPRADARTLVRRAYVDLIGLPPTPGQVDAFVSDPSPEAWARLIDELLASPHYGERWGRHWLDVARYADSGGFETDMYYRNAWRYRDYVVKSFNADKPYDVFVQEQIAGDELWPGNIDQAGSYEVPAENLRRLEARTGTGLYTLGPQVHESNMDGQKIRYETFSDWVDTTGAAFMGLTMGCARCHDHKFDPISQRDYYGMQAIFAGSKEVLEPTVPPMSVADFKQHYPRVVAVDEARRAVRLFDVRTKGRDLSEAEKAERQGLINRVAEAVLAVPQKTAQGEDFDGLFEVPSVSVLGHENPDLVPAIHILNRGELTRPEAQVSPALPEALREASGWTDGVPGPSGSRTALARWLTSPAHPLTARVMVNRIWYGHFGRGIVASLNDFGQMGERPTHPELLDWLATEFVQRGWSVKQMHRLIMLSATYQMDSTFQNADNFALDPANHFLWKMNRRRLEAEALWDAIHAVSGTINLKIGGRPVVPPLMADEGAPTYWTVSADPAEHNRRGLYVLQRRNFRFPMFDVFDLPVNAVSAPSRDTTSVATQALWLLNNATAQQQAEAFAARLTGSQDDGWNKPDFGPGQPGWEGAKAGPHAGWAKRIEFGPALPLDAPAGTVMTHGPTSVAWRVTPESAGEIGVRGGLWDLRHVGRSGAWKLWHNSTLLREGVLDDSSGSSAAPLPLNSGSGDDSPIRVTAAAGDLLRLEILQNDYVGIQLQFSAPKATRDISSDFSLEANPTATGWQYSESIANGGGPLTRALQAITPAGQDTGSLVEQAWRYGLGRVPTADEKTEALALLQKLAPENPNDALAQLCLAIFNLQEFAYVD